MPKQAINYSKTIIYKIVCNDLNVTETYVGHTTNMVKRRCQHKANYNCEKGKKHNLKVYQTIRANGGWDNWSMIQICEFPCNNMEEARAEERRHYELLNASLNSVIPYKSQDETTEYKTQYGKKWREENKDYTLEYNDNYYNINKQSIIEQKREYYQANKDIIAEKSKKKYDINRDTILEKAREYSKNNKEARAIASKKWRDANKKANAEKKRIYYKTNKEVILEKMKAHREANKDAINAKKRELYSNKTQTK